MFDLNTRSMRKLDKILNVFISFQHSSTSLLPRSPRSALAHRFSRNFVAILRKCTGFLKFLLGIIVFTPWLVGEPCERIYVTPMCW